MADTRVSNPEALNPEKLKEMTKAMIAQLEIEDALFPTDGDSELKPLIP